MPSLEIGRGSEEHTSELQSHSHLVCRLLLEKKKIEPLLADDEVDEVMVNGPGNVYVERRGRIERFFFLMIRRPPRFPLFPYTPLFRSRRRGPRRRPARRQPRRLLRRQRRDPARGARSEEHTSELQPHSHLVCRLLL